MADDKADERKMPDREKEPKSGENPEKHAPSDHTGTDNKGNPDQRGGPHTGRRSRSHSPS